MKTPDIPDTSDTGKGKAPIYSEGNDFSSDVSARFLFSPPTSEQNKNSLARSSSIQSEINRHEVHIKTHPLGFPMLTALEGAQDQDGSTLPGNVALSYHGNNFLSWSGHREQWSEQPDAYRAHFKAVLQGSKKFGKKYKELLKSVPHTRDLLSQFALTVEADQNDALVDYRHREVCMWPVTLPPKQAMSAPCQPTLFALDEEVNRIKAPSSETGQSFLYPWVTDQKAWDSRAEHAEVCIKEFNLNNCLFGGSLYGLDSSNAAYLLIDHEINIPDGEMIHTVNVVDQELHPYEWVAFAAFEAHIPLMNQLGDRSYKMRYHLPVIDYMLYGVHLYIAGKMTYAALGDYVEAVKKRGAMHHEILECIAKQHGCESRLIIESPFDNLFPPGTDITCELLLNLFSLSDEQLESLEGDADLVDHMKTVYQENSRRENRKLVTIIEYVNHINTWERKSSDSSQERLDMIKAFRHICEELFVEGLLELLSTNPHVPIHQKTWARIRAAEQVDRFSPLSHLFKVANISMIGCAFTEDPSIENFQVCSFLSLEEKPIPTNYQKYLSKEEHFGDIICLSYLPALMSAINTERDAYLEKNQNNLFRFQNHEFYVPQHQVKEALRSMYGTSEDVFDDIQTLFDAYKSTSSRSSPSCVMRAPSPEFCQTLSNDGNDLSESYADLDQDGSELKGVLDELTGGLAQGSEQSVLDKIKFLLESINTAELARQPVLLAALAQLLQQAALHTTVSSAERPVALGSSYGASPLTSSPSSPSLSPCF